MFSWIKRNQRKVDHGHAKHRDRDLHPEVQREDVVAQKITLEKVSEKIIDPTVVNK